MTDITLYHNPRCSKSRQALTLLKEKGVAVREVHYLQTPLTVAELTALIHQLGLPHAHDLLRTKEPEYKQAGLDKNSSDKDVIRALAAFPGLMERPVAVNGNKAVIGRPPERVLEVL
jgi:arsenate reductase